MKAMVEASQKRRCSCMAHASKSATALSHHKLYVSVPYRLDLTVSVLRRLSSNVVDVLTPEGDYTRTWGGFGGPMFVRVSQQQPDALSVTLAGNSRDHRRALALVRRMLGVDCDLAHFDRAAARISWLRPLARRMRGVKPPRYPTLWEACVNAIVFQQLSLFAASTILKRMIVSLSPLVQCDGVALHAFPSVEHLLGAKDRVLRAAGLSTGKLATLRRVGDALASGALDEKTLQRLTSSDAKTLLGRIKGIGPWTATLILLRGLGRLDVFPANDSSVARNLAFVAGSASLDTVEILNALSPQQGMLYYHLLLARLDARGDVGRASFVAG